MLNATIAAGPHHPRELDHFCPARLTMLTLLSIVTSVYKLPYLRAERRSLQ